jgi:DUF4097 and DUF4098 domain-containing protein YvlB
MMTSNSGKTSKIGMIVVLCAVGGATLALSGCKVCAMHSMQKVEAASDSGAVHIHKMGGDIEVADAPNGASLHTMGGNIHVGNVASFAQLKTMGGNITVGRAQGSVDASTMGGVIHIDDTNGPIKASTMGGDLTVREIGSSAERRDIELDSKGGTIQLVVPRDFPMEVRIQLAYTRNAPRQFHIIDKLGLAQQESQDWESSFGSARKYIREEGVVGSGLNHVTIKTINGDVILKQE